MGRTSDAKEKLIAAMAALVHRRGYVAVSVDDVCAEAGVRKGSFYHFFASKRDLMLAALQSHQEMARDHVLEIAFAPTLPPLERLDRFFALVAGMETANKKSGGHVLGCPFGNLAAEVAASEPELARAADQALGGLAFFIQSVLQEAKKRGDIDRRADVKETADAILAYFEGVALLARTRNDPSLLKKLGPRAMALATELTSPRPATRSPSSPAGSSPARRRR